MALWFEPSFDRTTFGSQTPPPDRASVPVNTTVTFCLRQPNAFAPGPALAVTTGAVASRLILTELVAVPPALVAEQVNVAPAVSSMTLTEAQPVRVTHDRRPAAADRRAAVAATSQR